MPSLLPRSFYDRPVFEVAPDLLGKILVFRNRNSVVSGRIVETEAYANSDDAASHAHRGRTPRNTVMFGPPGHAYVYFIYGMYHCFNVVSDNDGTAGACLVRALEPMEGLNLMRKRRGTGVFRQLASGPGKLCRAMGISRRQNGTDLTGEVLFLSDDGFKVATMATSARVGIRHATDRPWRFYIKDHPCLSVRKVR